MRVEFQNCLDAALRLEALGVSVIPLRARDKRPSLKSWREYQERRATPEEIRDWFTTHPEWNLGLICGAISGVSVIDIDGEEGEVWFKEHDLPKSNLWQVTSGPHKCHLIYRHPGAGFVVHPSVDTDCKVDVRGDGSYIVCAPSVHPSGAVYAMGTKAASLEDAFQALQLMPGMFVESPSDRMYTATPAQTAPVTAAPLDNSEVLPAGGRNSGLTSMCGSWYGKGLRLEEVLTLALGWNATHCQPPLDEREVETIVRSMQRTHAGNNPDLLNTGGVSGWVSRAKGEFSVTDIYRDLGVCFAPDKAKVRREIDMLLGNGVIEQAGSRDGVYRKRDTVLEEIDLMADEGDELDIWLPFGLSNCTSVYSGNVILVAGETNAGKTGLLLNIVAKNWRHRFRYLASEMTPRELRNRLLAFGIPVEEWRAHCEFVQRSQNFHDAIDPDGVNIIDYLEVCDEFYKTGKYITQIFERLRKGIAIVSLQKKKGEMFGRGGEFALEKPRLGISLFTHGHTPDGVFGSAVVTKAKNIKGSNPQGKEIFYRLNRGVEYVTTPLMSCPTIREGLHYYSEQDRKKALAEIKAYCQAAQKPEMTPLEDEF